METVNKQEVIVEAVEAAAPAVLPAGVLTPGAIKKLNALAAYVGQPISAEVIKTDDFGQEYEVLTTIIKFCQDLKSNIDNGVKQTLKTRYLDSGENNLSSKTVCFSYVPASTRQGFNTNGLKKDFPEIWQKYVTSTPVKDCVRNKAVKTEDEH